METETQNALDRFISKARELFAREPDPDKRWTGGHAVEPEYCVIIRARNSARGERRYTGSYLDI